MSEKEPFDAGAPEREYIKSVLRAREATLDFFRPGEDRQFARELWCARTFVADLGSPGEESEFTKVPGDITVDVAFRDARFQEKEIMQANRRRGDEIRHSIDAAKKAQRASELLTPFSLEALTPRRIGKLIAKNMPKYVARCPCQPDRASIDLLVYVNLERATIDKTVPKIPEIVQAGWRSVSVVTNDGSMVFHADDSAPAFIRENLRKGKLKRRMPEIPGNTHIRLRFAHSGAHSSSSSVLARAHHLSTACWIV